MRNAIPMLLLAMALPAWAAGSSQVVSVQGVLRHGGALQSMPVDLDVSLYANQGDATPFYTQHLPQVPVDNGFFSIELGGSGLTFAGQADAWVGVLVGGDASELPRQHVAAVPYAMSAASADALSSACVGCVTAAMLSSDATSGLQRALKTPACPAGQLISAIAADGTVTCEPPSGWVKIYDTSYNGNGVQTIPVTPSHGTITLRILFHGTVQYFSNISEIRARMSADAPANLGDGKYRSWIVGDTFSGSATMPATQPLHPSLLMARGVTVGNMTVAFDYQLTETPGLGVMGFGTGTLTDGAGNSVLFRTQGSDLYSGTSSSLLLSFWNTMMVTGRFTVLQLM